MNEHEELFETLRRDHQEVRETFRKLKEEERTSERVRLLYELETEILPHMVAEERVLYPRLKEGKDAGARDDALESMVEHHAVRLVLRDLAETPANDEVFPAKVRVLEEMVEHHLREEESGIFQDVERTLGGHEAAEILEGFRREKECTPCQPAGRSWLME